MDFGSGVQNLLVEDIVLRDYLRQGVDLAGNAHSQNYTVRRVSELPWQTVVKPGGSTIHVEEATGLRDVLLADSVCNHSLLASTTLNMTIKNCTIVGQLVGNSNTQMTIENNTIIATSNRSMASFLNAQGATFSNNTLHSSGFEGGQGVYFWGHDEGYPSAHNILIADNHFLGDFMSEGKTVQLFGVDGVMVEGNTYTGGKSSSAALRTCECCRDPAKIALLCVNVSIYN